MCLQQLWVPVDSALHCNCELSHVWSHSVSPCNATHGHCGGRHVCVCLYVSGVTEAHSPVPPKSTKAHLDLTQTALFANKNTPSPKLDLPFFFLLVIVFLLLFTPLPFVLPATFNLVTCLFAPYPRPLCWQTGGLLKVEGKVWWAFIKWAQGKDCLAK